jgi:opacity protein-like surface antigen
MILKELVILLLVPLFSLWIGCSHSVHAENYAGISLGTSLAHDVTDIRGTTNAGVTATATGINVSPNDSFTYGFKVGHYFRYMPWFGVEFNFYQRGPDVEKQVMRSNSSVTVNGNAGILTALGTGQLKVDVNSLTTLGFLVMIRATQEQTINLYNFEPFLGIGLGVNRVDLGDTTTLTESGAFNSETNLGSDTSIGVLMSAGLNYKLTRKVKVYGEYKYTSSSYNLRAADEVDYELDIADSSLVFGASYSF